MATGLFHAHSGIRYLIFLLLLIVIIKSLANFISDKEWGSGDKKITTMLMGFTHLQVVLGLIMYVYFKHYTLFSNMSDPIDRWKAVEHGLAMIIFAVVVSVLHIVNKKPNKANKNRRALILGLLAFAIGFAGIPLSRWFQ